MSRFNNYEASCSYSDPRYEYLDHDLFPEQVQIYRFDQDDRVSNGFETARTIISRDLGLTAMHGFLGDDVTCHLASNFSARLAKPSKSNAGVGSPFVSGSFKPSQPQLKGIESRGEIEDSSLYTMTVPRTRIIVPTLFKHPHLKNWQEHAPEVLVVGVLK